MSPRNQTLDSSGKWIPKVDSRRCPKVRPSQTQVGGGNAPHGTPRDNCQPAGLGGLTPTWLHGQTLLRAAQKGCVFLDEAGSSWL